MSIEWEVDTDSGKTFMVCDGPDTVVCRGIRKEEVAKRIAALPRLERALDQILARLSNGSSYQAGQDVADIARAARSN